MLEKMKNAWRIPELRKKIIYTFGMLLMYRLLCVIPVPGINVSAVASAVKDYSILDFMNMMTGGSFQNMSIMAMGITPYINSSIILQLLTVAIPALEKLANEGPEGRKKINEYTRYLTVVLAFIQAVGLVFAMRANSYGGVWYLVIGLSMAAGSALAMWIGERITENGIGNGISMILFADIISRIPTLISNMVTMLGDGSLKWYGAILIVIGMLALMAFIVFITNSERRIPVQYAKRVVGRKMYGGQSTNLPIKVNMSGVMPIIFAQALMFIPMFFTRFEATRGFAAAFADYTGFWYNLVFALLVIAFTYFYTAITVNPNMMAEDMKRNGGFIPGVKPGKKTVEYLDTIMTRITLPGSIFLAIVAILPTFAMKLGINNQFALFYGGTSLLILVGVVLDTLQQIESYLLLRHYDGLMKTGRIKGRVG